LHILLDYFQLEIVWPNAVEGVFKLILHVIQADQNDRVQCRDSKPYLGMLRVREISKVRAKNDREEVQEHAAWTRRDANALITSLRCLNAPLMEKTSGKFTAMPISSVGISTRKLKYRHKAVETSARKVMRRVCRSMIWRKFLRVFNLEFSVDLLLKKVGNFPKPCTQ